MCFWGEKKVNKKMMKKYYDYNPGHIVNACLLSDIENL